MGTWTLLIAFVVAVLAGPSLSWEQLEESDLQRVFKIKNIAEAPEHEIVYPRVVTEEGALAITGEALCSDTLRIRVRALGEDFDLTLRRDDFGIAPDFEMMAISAEGKRKLPIRTDSMYSGRWNSNPETVITAEASAGLHVMIFRPGGPLYISPLKDHPASGRGHGMAHIAYRGTAEAHCTVEPGGAPYRKVSEDAAIPVSGREQSQKVLELAMYSDNELYKEYGDDTGMKILRLYGSAAGLLELPSLSSNNLMVKLTGGGVIKDQGELQTSENARASLAVCRDHAEANMKAPGEEFHFDNAAYITGFDLSGRLKGTAYVGVCGKPGCVSLSEFGSGPEGMAVTAAHEIGHNLGCLHDHPRRGCQLLGYIMAPHIDGTEDEWSTCSKSFYENFVNNDAKDANGNPCYDDGGQW